MLGFVFADRHYYIYPSDVMNENRNNNNTNVDGQGVWQYQDKLINAYTTITT